MPIKKIQLNASDIHHGPISGQIHLGEHVEPTLRFSEGFKELLSEYLRSEEGRAVLDEVVAERVDGMARQVDGGG